MTTCTKENLVEDVLALIHVNSEFLKAVPQGQDYATECLQDMHTHLCELLSKMIASPLTGRVFMPGPDMYVGTKTRLQSLQQVFNT